MSSPLIQQAITQLRREGGRMTEQRRLILETLESRSDHPTAEDVYEQVRKDCPDINLSTVYRTLRWLEEVGLVGARWFEDEPRQERFDPVTHSGEVDHYHFRCRFCNHIIEFPAPLLEKIKSDFVTDYGGKVESATLTLYGICENCQAKVK